MTTFLNHIIIFRLSAQSCLTLRKEILSLQEELAITLIYVTHDREEAFSLASRIVVMESGKIQKTGTVSEITAYLSGL